MRSIRDRVTQSIGVLVFFLCIPLCAHGADVSFAVVPNTIPGDTAVVVEAYLLGGEESLNALEGTLGFVGEGSAALTDVVIETGDSFFTLWPVPPTYDATTRTVRFVGGSVIGERAKSRILRMRLFVDRTSTFALSWLGGSGYRDDGQGTPVGISSRSLTLTAQTGEPNQIRPTSVDTVPPRIETALVVRDENLYDGQYHVSIYATDDISGVAYYEVQEGGATTHVTEGSYLVRDQSMRTPIFVTVYDKAGNSISVNISNEKVATVWYVILAGILIVLTTFLWRFWAREALQKCLKNVEK